MNQNAKIDPDVKIPAAVKAASEKSDKLWEELRDKPQGEDSGDEASTSRGTEGHEAGEDQNVTPEGNPDLDPSKMGGDEKPEPKKSEAKPEAKTEAKPEAKTEDEESWEHKYKSIHGRYVRSQNQIKQLSDEIRNLQNVIATMQSTAPAEKKDDKTPDLDPSSLLTPEEIADYGDDFLQVVGKRARQEVAPLIKKYEDEIESLKKQLKNVDGHVKQSAQEKLHSKLDEKLPKWRELNTNPDFLDWLALPDPYSGGIRHDMLKAAYAHGDVHRVLAFFNGFLAEEAAVAPAETGEPDPTEQKVDKVPLKNLAAPGRAKTTAATSAPAEKPIITRAQIGQFYADVASGKYRGKEEEKNRLEGMIFEAEREGRIR